MGGWNSIDWTYLEGLFGKYGKLITAVIAVLTAVIPLLAAIFSYLHSRVLKKERDQARADLNRERLQVKKEQAAVDKEKGKVQRREEALETKNAALQKAAARLIDQEAALKERERKLNHVRTAFKGKEHELWCMHAARKPESYDSRMVRQRSKPIIMVANLKGGVGKTTLCANLAAHFSAVGKRVLLLDVDYQGSLSNMLLSADGVEVVSAEVNKLLTPGADFLAFKSAARPFKKILNGSSIVPGKYEFASLENQVMIDYLLQSEEDDGRYRLARVLLEEDVSSLFDVTLIDAPPRLTAGAINAFCSSTHLLVPTVYDELSAETIGTFLNGAQVLRTSLNHSIDLLGIVGMLTSAQTGLNVREQNAQNIAADEVFRTWGANHHFFRRHIPRRAAIAAAAGNDIAYHCDDVVRGWFDVLGAEISERLQWDDDSPSDHPPDSAIQEEERARRVPPQPGAINP